MARSVEIVEKQLKSANERIAILRASLKEAERSLRQKTDELDRIVAELKREKTQRAERVSLALEAALAKRSGGTEVSATLSDGGMGTSATLWLVDGYNTLCGLASRYNRPTGNPVIDSKERRRFATDIARMFEHRPAVRVSIVFDAPTHSEVAVSPNVRIIYSGGTGEHRADKVLVDALRFYHGEEGPQPPCVLVSDDAKLRDAASRLGATLLTAKQFGQLS